MSKNRRAWAASADSWFALLAAAAFLAAAHSLFIRWSVALPSASACSASKAACDSTVPAWGLSRWRPEVLRAGSLGQLPTVVDGVWIEAIADESLARLGPGLRPRLFHTFDLLTDLDPAFFEAYDSAGSLLAIIRDDPRGARTILEKGERFRTQVLPSADTALREGAWREQWRLPFQLGYISLFEEGDLAAAEAYFTTAGSLPGAPLLFQRLGERFRRPGGRYEVGLNVVSMELRNEGLREELRTELEAKRDSLLVRLEAARVDDAFQQWRLRHRLEADGSSFRRFLGEHSGVRPVDSFGGAFFVAENGRVDSRTPRVPVFGMP